MRQHGRVVAGAATDEAHALGASPRIDGEPGVNLEWLHPNASAQALIERLRRLVNLLEHVVGMPCLLGLSDVPIHTSRPQGLRVPCVIVDADAVPRDDAMVPVFQEHDLPGVFDDGRYVAGQDGLPVAHEAEDERGAVGGEGEAAVVGIQEHEGPASVEGGRQLTQRGLGIVGASRALEEVRQHF